MEFQIRKAEPADVRGIMRIMEQAGKCHIHPEWFVADDEAYVRAHLEQRVQASLLSSIRIRMIIWEPTWDLTTDSCLRWR